MSRRWNFLGCPHRYGRPTKYMSQRCVFWQVSINKGKNIVSLLDDYPCPLIAILRGLTPSAAPVVGQVLFDAGFRLLEVPLNRPGALEAIRILRRIAPPDALIGGGTMLSPGDGDAAGEASGPMMVSPHWDP